MSKTENSIKTGMMKSHAERLAQAPKVYPKNLCADYEVRGTEEVVECDRVIKKSCVKKVHPQDMFAGYKASDFALENIIAVGALDSLKECQMSANSLSELSDSMEGSIDNAIAAVDAAEASVNNSNDGGNE